ncbi:MAG: Gfo/Idh/MocA family oxidoreductase [Victivallales bacterium]|nr:Gfo/Idh/MocA family oxidoreductase [Victivallales bacterium]
MKKLKVGVIGLGMGASHVRGFNSHPSSEVMAVADVDKARLDSRADELGVEKRYSDPMEMLAKEKLDIAAIVVPNKFHKPLTIAALEAGCHVLCEKPMAMNAKEAEEMLKASKRCRKRLMINFSFRFTPQSYALKQEVDSGILGKIYYARTVWLRRRGMPGFGGWFGQKKLAGGGPIIDLGVHRLDLALYLMNYPKPVWVMAATFDHIAREKALKSGKLFDVEDMGVASIKFDDGAMLTLEASWAGNIKNNEEMETRLLGSKGGLRQFNLGEGYEFDAEIYLERDGRQYDMRLHPPVPAARQSMHHLVDCIIEDKPHTATGEEGLVVMKILDAIYKSAATGKPVSLK